MTYVYVKPEWRHAVEVTEENGGAKKALELLLEWGHARGLEPTEPYEYHHLLRRHGAHRKEGDALVSYVPDEIKDFYGMNFIAPLGKMVAGGMSRLRGYGRRISEELTGHEEYWPIAAGEYDTTIAKLVTEDDLRDDAR